MLSSWVLATMPASGCGAFPVGFGCHAVRGSTGPFALVSVLRRHISAASGCSLIYPITR